ncbi:YfiR family protein [Azonexus sp. IMCC34839]|uniref:YfiR family protein n=1 Tax=Azonexus sp. IMCC34839 TaxID=3133695 RepID=UPI00399B80CF
MKALRRPLHRLAASWLLICSWPCLLAGQAFADDISEYGMKAVLFYRLPQFIYWPSGEPEPKPMALCIVGKNPFGNAISQLKQGNDNIDLRISPADISSCNLLFISRSENANLDNWLSRADSRRMLTVSDIPGFARSGGMIELPVEGERVGIVINRRIAMRKGFEFNAQLLRLARVINP